MTEKSETSNVWGDLSKGFDDIGTAQFHYIKICIII